MGRGHHGWLKSKDRCEEMDVPLHAGPGRELRIQSTLQDVAKTVVRPASMRLLHLFAVCTQLVASDVEVSQQLQADRSSRSCSRELTEVGPCEEHKWVFQGATLADESWVALMPTCFPAGEPTRLEVIVSNTQVFPMR